MMMQDSWYRGAGAGVIPPEFEEDGYGVVKVGFTTAEGVKHFTNIENVRAQVSEDDYSETEPRPYWNGVPH